jgi:hypothetical protein
VSPSLRLTTPLVFLGLVVASWLLPNTLDPAEDVQPLASRTSFSGELENREGLLVLHLSGSPYGLGYQHGTLLRQEVRARIQTEVYGGLVEERGVSHLLLLRRARQIDAILTEEYREELRGLADGSGVSYLQVLVLNTAEELVGEKWTANGVRQLMLALSPAFFPHFSATEPTAGSGVPNTLAVEQQMTEARLEGAFAGFGSATIDGRLLQGAWFASPPPALGELVVVICQPNSGNSYVGVGKPGAIGLFAGMNEEGLAVTTLKSPSQDASLVGISAPMLLREVLQNGGGLPTALSIMTSAQRTTGQNVLIGDNKRPDAQALEFSAHDFAVFPAANELVARTQHYLDTELGRTQYSLPWWDGDKSWEDLDSLLRALESAYGGLDSETAGTLVARLAQVEGDASVAEELVLGIVLDGRTQEITVVTGPEGQPSRVVGLDEGR